jgi:hypothetical protein
MNRKYKQVTITFDDKHLPCVFVNSQDAIGVFERLLADPVQQAPRRILNNAFDHVFTIINDAIAHDEEKNTLFLLLYDLYAIKIALNVIIRGHRVIGITLDKEV